MGVCCEIPKGYFVHKNTGVVVLASIKTFCYTNYIIST